MNNTNETIYCACGCGGTLERYWYDKFFYQKKERKYIHGHNTIIKKQQKKCDKCGKDIMVPAYQIKKNKHFFCSKECAGAYKKSTRVEIKCNGCGIAFYVIRARKEKAKYCTKECRLKYESITRPCCQCGKSVTRNRATMLQERIYCNKECQHQWLAENIRQETHPLWLGGAIHYRGANWRQAKKETIKRDGGRCRLCGGVRRISVHHITPIKEFQIVEDGNSLENLVCLCTSCHNKAEPKGKINPLNERLRAENFLLYAK